MMMLSRTEQPVAPLQRPSAQNVRVGKDIIEILTSGMYVSPLSVYREYIQNSADSIDDRRAKEGKGRSLGGVVDINIDHQSRSVTIRDDGAGVAGERASDILLAIGGSTKRGTSARGFRGVGRLSGLAYCRELVFRTKAKGDAHVTTVSWDCRELRNKLSDPKYSSDIRELVSQVAKVGSEKAEKADHFFEVQMREVARFRQDALLNEQLISHYLAQVAPVGFSEAFSAGEEIQQRLENHGVRRPIDVSVAGARIHKLYADRMQIPGREDRISISNIEYFELADADAGVGAVGWLGHHEYARSIPVGLGVGGLRSRVGNVQVGGADLFDDSFKESRFNGWTIGELHILDRRVVPNARRDDFEHSHHYANLLAQVGPLATRITQICRTTSISRSAAVVIANVIAEVQAALASSGKISRADVVKMRASLARARGKTRSIGEPKQRDKLIAKIEKLDKQLAAVKPTRGPPVVTVDEALRLVSKLVTNRAQAEKLAQALRHLSA